MEQSVQASITMSIACPCCNLELYTSTHPSGLYSHQIPGEKLYWREGKCFLECRHCQCEVLMMGAGYMLPSPMQLCRRKG